MKSGYEIIWSATANNDLDKIIDYLKSNWTEKEIRKFIQKLDSFLSLIQRNPLIFPISKYKKEVRRCVLTKHNSIYYNYTASKVRIITIYDNRSNPNKIKLANALRK
jgi:plasmid stabilization system protein ParE